MRPYGSSTDINVLCKNQSSPAQPRVHSTTVPPLPVCSLMLIDTVCSLQCMPLSPLFCMLQTRNANQARLRARLKQPGESKTRVYRERNVLFFSSFFFALLHLPSNRLTLQSTSSLWVASVCCPFSSTSLPFDLVDSILWPASYTPLFVAEVVVILNYKRGIVHGDFSLFSILHLCHWTTPP